MSENKVVKLNDAGAAELRAYAETQLGITFGGAESKVNMRAKILEAKPDLVEIPALEKAAGPTQQGDAPKPVTASQPPPAPEKVRIIINRTEDPGGDEHVPVSVNGRAMLIPRGETVEIPLPYFQVLQNAVRHVYDPLPDGKGINPKPREVPMYPYQRV